MRFPKPPRTLVHSTSREFYLFIQSVTYILDKLELLSKSSIWNLIITVEFFPIIFPLGNINLLCLNSNGHSNGKTTSAKRPAVSTVLMVIAMILFVSSEKFRPNRDGGMF